MNSVATARRFNRFYTRQIGVLNEGLLGSPYSLTEGRVLFELAQRDHSTASELSRDLGIDAGYLSRMLRRFEQNGLLGRKPLPEDGRQSLLKLTAKGRKAFAKLDRRSEEDVAGMLRRLPEADQGRLLGAMGTIEALLGAAPPSTAPYVLRDPRPGDIGWVIERHGALYARESGFDWRFEALVAGIAAHFVENFNPRKERAWIAERDGENVGSIFLAKDSDEVAKLRLLLIEPAARGMGLGKHLVSECIRFARQAGYRKITLWTNHDLYAARHIYEKAGFVRVLEEPMNDYGRAFVAETWEMGLS